MTFIADDDTKVDSDTTLPVTAVQATHAPAVTIRLVFDHDRGPIDSELRKIGPTPTVIGRSPGDRGLQILDMRVSRQHARIWRRPGSAEVILEDTSSNGVFLNGQRVAGTAVLRDNDLIRVGNSFLVLRFLFRDDGDASIPALVGVSPAMMRLRNAIAMIAPTTATVLVVGESGTGKELVARALHAMSGRQGPFVAVNCAAIPSTLAESQLFGHVAGSFTGATDDHEGYFRMAEGGTLLLDEVGELPQEIQPKLLRVLEERVVTAVGAVRPISVNIRIIAATNRDLDEAISTGKFRGDLFARLAELTIKTPPLKERREDILPLLGLGYGSLLPDIAPDLVEALLLHPWRFNVRELFKVSTELRLQAPAAGALEMGHVQHRLTRLRGGEEETLPSISADEPPASQAVIPPAAKDRDPIPSREQFVQLLSESQGNISQLSRQLNRSRRQIYRYLEMYDLVLDDYREVVAQQDAAPEALTLDDPITYPPRS